MAKRRIEALDTDHGSVSIKIATCGERIINVSPEYDDCKKIALDKNIPLKIVIDTVKSKIAEKY
jgi:hypothetical protein